MVQDGPETFLDLFKFNPYGLFFFPFEEHNMYLVVMDEQVWLGFVSVQFRSNVLKGQQEPHSRHNNIAEC